MDEHEDWAIIYEDSDHPITAISPINRRSTTHGDTSSSSSPSSSGTSMGATATDVTSSAGNECTHTRRFYAGPSEPPERLPPVLPCQRSTKLVHGPSTSVPLKQNRAAKHSSGQKASSGQGNKAASCRHKREHHRHAARRSKLSAPLATRVTKEPQRKSPRHNHSARSTVVRDRRQPATRTNKPRKIAQLRPMSIRTDSSSLRQSQESDLMAPLIQTGRYYGVATEGQVLARLEKTEFLLFNRRPTHSVHSMTSLPLIIGYRTSQNEYRHYHIEEAKGHYRVLSADDKAPTFDSLPALVHHYEVYRHRQFGAKPGSGNTDRFPWWLDDNAERHDHNATQHH